MPCAIFPILLCTDCATVFSFCLFVVLINGTFYFDNTAFNIDALQADQLSWPKPDGYDKAIRIYKSILARIVTPSAHRTGEQFFDIAGLYGLFIAFRRIIRNFDFLWTKRGAAISTAIFQETHHRIAYICEHLFAEAL